MRILMVHARYRAPGGEDVSAAIEARLLRRRGHEIELMEFDSTEMGSGWTAAARTLWNGQAVRRVRDRMNAFMPDVLHVQNLFPAASPAVLAVGLSSRAAVVQTLRNTRIVCPAATSWWDGAQCTACRSAPWTGTVRGCWRESRAATAVATVSSSLHRRLLRRVHLIITPSQYLRSALEPVTEGPVVVVPNSLETLPPTFSGPRSGILFAGRLVAEKGVADLLAALPLLPGDVPVTVMGDGPQWPLVLAAMKTHPNLKWHGHLPHPEVLAAMAKALVVVVPSRWGEPFGRVALEGLAAGCAVVATRTGGLPEVVGDAGLLVPPSEPAALADAIGRALDGWSAFSAAAARRYGELFDDGGSRLETALAEAVHRKRSASIRNPGTTHR